jgi:hypothetical protein
MDNSCARSIVRHWAHRSAKRGRLQHKSGQGTRRAGPRARAGRAPAGGRRALGRPDVGVAGAPRALADAARARRAARRSRSFSRGDGTLQGRGPPLAWAPLRESRSRRLRPLLRGVGGEPARAVGPRGRDEPAGDRAGPGTGSSLQRGPLALLRRRRPPMSGRTGCGPGAGRGGGRAGAVPRLRPRARVGHHAAGLGDEPGRSRRRRDRDDPSRHGRDTGDRIGAAPLGLLGLLADACVSAGRVAEGLPA